MFYIRGVLLFGTGIALSEIVSYLWHKYAEHGGLLGNAISYRHWLHHEVEYPLTKLRQKKKYQTQHPWSWYIPGAIVTTFLLVLPWTIVLPVFVGMFCDGVIVVKLHETFHVRKHWLNRYKYYRRLVRYHTFHHMSRCNYGISVFVVDRLSGSFQRSKPAKQSLFPNMIE